MVEGKKSKFRSVDPKVEFPQLEKEILRYWQENKIFEKTLGKTKSGKAYIFYEGPPTANGRPGIHHVLSRSFKDLFPRYHTMKGEYCIRKGGWDSHGLPVEIEVEKQLGISGKKDIENLVPGDKKASIAKFNQACRESVFRYVEDWKNLTERMGYWVDLDNPYVTLDKKYIESCWAILKNFANQGLLEKDYKVVPYCPRCGTPLSSHELSLGYADAKDHSIYIKFKLVGEDASFLVWTTTPWTLPANIALAINPGAMYVKVQVGSDRLILVKDRLDVVSKAKILEEFKGEQLVGKKYEPLYSFHDFGEKVYQVYPADFVSLEDGTGIVHTAVMYGADDFDLGKKVGLPMYHLVNEEGKFKEEVAPWKGEFVKDVDLKVIEDLKSRNLLFKQEIITHSYPFCWRCSTPLLYYAISSWFIRTTRKKEEIIQQNKKTNWVPKHMGTGRMGKWLDGMVDWSLSRLRYWATPLPIWQCKNEHTLVIGSYQELADLSGNSEVLNDSFDPHRPYVDDIVIKCKECGEEALRVPDLVDVWFDSGAVPFAQYHYPFENQEKIDQAEQFPADFVAEGQDQTRGWFYTLLAIGTLYKGRNSYKNVVSHNLVLDAQGRKMSKSKGNVVNPQDVINKYGADSVRFYFYSSVNVGIEYKFDEKDIEGTSRRVFRILWNVYNFFVQNASADGWVPKEGNSQRLLDLWVYSKFYSTLDGVEKSLDKYDPTEASRLLVQFIDQLSGWYVRRSRDRVGPNVGDVQDKEDAYSTLWDVLVKTCRILAPFAPFISEEIYKNLTGEESVHLSSWPEFDKTKQDGVLEENMGLVQKIVEKGHAARKEKGIPVRQPLAKISVFAEKTLGAEYFNLIKGELNVKNVECIRGDKLSVDLDTTMTPALEEEGKVRELARSIQEERKKLGTPRDAEVIVRSPWLPENPELLEWLKRRTLAKSITKGDSLQIVQGD